MTQGPEVTAHTGPIRCQGPVKVRALMAPVTIKVRGTPGPAGPQLQALGAAQLPARCVIADRNYTLTES